MLEVEIIKKRDSFILQVDIKISGTGCILGKNGAGKSTFLSIVAGILKADKGKIILNERDITNMSIEDRKVVLVTPGSYLPNINVDQHLLWGMNNKKAEENQSISEIKSRLGINFSGLLNSLSSGMKIKVAIATALLSGAELILVDEAFSFIDDREGFIKETIRICNQKGKQVIFSSQEVSDSVFAEEVYFLKDGKGEKVK